MGGREGGGISLSLSLSNNNNNNNNYKNNNSVSGSIGSKFLFEGFLPKKSSQRMAVLEQYEQSPYASDRPLIFFESPHRIVDSLKDCQKVFGKDRELTLCREMTKKFETIVRARLEIVRKTVEANPKGEIVVVVDPLTSANRRKKTTNDSGEAEAEEEEEEEGAPTPGIDDREAKIKKFDRNS